MLEEWQKAYIKWVHDKEKREDDWTEEELEEARDRVYFTTDHAKAFRAGYVSGRRNTRLFFIRNYTLTKKT